MWPLIHQNLRHILRTRLLFLMLLFSFVVHYVGVKIVHSATVYFNGVVAVIDARDALFVSLVFQLFTAGFVSAIYGIWMVPYAHQGGRSPLTFTLPVSKWKFPLTYFLCMLVLLVLENLMMLGSFGMNFGWETFQQKGFPWGSLITCLALQGLAFESLMFGLALCSMLLGQITTFFLGTLALFLLQVAGAVFRFKWGSFVATPPPSFLWAQKVYSQLPPFGELVVDLRHQYLNPSWHYGNLWLWAGWLLAFMVLFRFKLRYPSHARSSE